MSPNNHPLIHCNLPSNKRAQEHSSLSFLSIPFNFLVRFSERLRKTKGKGRINQDTSSEHLSTSPNQHGSCSLLFGLVPKWLGVAHEAPNVCGELDKVCITPFI